MPVLAAAVEGAVAGEKRGGARQRMGDGCGRAFHEAYALRIRECIARILPGGVGGSPPLPRGGAARAWSLHVRVLLPPPLAAGLPLARR